MRLLVASLLGLLLPFSAGAAELVGQATVIDGDTIEIHGQRIRLNAIDAPESRQLCKDGAGKDYRCGQVAALALADKIGRHTVSCDDRGRDRYGRQISVCQVAGVDLGGWLVEQGLAVEYRRYSQGQYRAVEDHAKAAHTGLWAGSFDWPWDWRLRQHKSSSQNQ